MARDRAYWEAMARIRAAQRLETELSLSGIPLTELPRELTQLWQLQNLDLSHTKLTELPDWLQQLGGLVELNLSDAQIRVLPDWLHRFTKLQSLNLSGNNLTAVPESLAQLTSLRNLSLSRGKITSLPEWIYSLIGLHNLEVDNNRIGRLSNKIGNLTQLRTLRLHANHLTSIPASITQLRDIRNLSLSANHLGELPDTLKYLPELRFLYVGRMNIRTLPNWICECSALRELVLRHNLISELPVCLVDLQYLQTLDLDENPLNPELAAAYSEGLDAVKRYLRTGEQPQIALNEAKLILVGEGEVGKSCLLDALRDDPWEEHVSTHGIEIKPVPVTAPDIDKQITLNGWDFGGQRVYRPTHQLFFSTPAVYLVVWKPREGPQQGLVKEWIELVKRREMEAKILVVATHGGPGQRQPDIDRQELWDLFGRETVIDFFHVDSMPDKNGVRGGITDLKEAIARVAAGLPEMGRTVPARWQQAREVLKQTQAAYLPLERVLGICREHGMADEEARLFVSISHRLGHLIYYEHDPTLRDIVVLKPDWLATAISFVLDDKQTRDNNGLVDVSRLNELWDDPTRPGEFRYPPDLHPIFLRLMERFDLSYRVAEPAGGTQVGETSLIAQLVPDVRPDITPAWPESVKDVDEQQVQICRIVDTDKGQSATAEGLFFQLIVRQHKYSVGRADYHKSVHWQRGLVLDDDYNGRALMEHVGNDIRITVRASYPEAFLSVLTHEVDWLVESFWQGLRCDVMVPCLMSRPDGEPCSGLFEVRKLIENKKRNRPEQPCPVCNEWQDIDCLLRNAPAAQRKSVEELLAQGFEQVRSRLDAVRTQLNEQDQQAESRFRVLDQNDRRIMSQVEDSYTRLMQSLTDEAKEGPRLFSFQPMEPGFFDRPKWVSQKFRLTLWCEHSRLPLPMLNGPKDTSGVYDLNLPRDWFVKAGPVLKVLTGTLSLILPIASSATKLVLDDAVYKGIENELDLGQKSIESAMKGEEQVGMWLAKDDGLDVQTGDAVVA
jgi:Leucine-rich repeat (LRR) protein